MNILREFPYKWGTDRDCEFPVLVEFVKSKVGQFESLLDVGAWYSHHTYLDVIRPLAPRYDAIDIRDDPLVRAKADNYYVGNVIGHPISDEDSYDMVICVSTVEHAGISTYKSPDYDFDQNFVFLSCVQAARKFLWISFPVGLPHFYPGEWAIIHREKLNAWEKLLRRREYKFKERFFYTEWAQMKKPWKEHDDREFALTRPYVDSVGTQSVCVLEVEK